MNVSGPSQGKSRLQEYVQIWIQSTTKVLEEVAGVPFTAQEVRAEDIGNQSDVLAAQGMWIRFDLTQGLTGEHGFLVSKEDGQLLARLLLGEPPEPQKDLTEGQRDALGELSRQFAGTAAVALKGLAGGEVKVQFGGLEHLHEAAEDRTSYVLTSSKLSPIRVFMELSSQLVSALKPDNSPRREAPTPATTPASTPVTSLDRDPKLDLLMDVELDVTLRFGARQMSLREVLELNAGSVVELDQQILDPVTLLVGGKVIARGEVVIVDGNYGLRVSETVSAKERLETLRG